MASQGCGEGGTLLRILFPSIVWYFVSVCVCVCVQFPALSRYRLHCYTFHHPEGGAASPQLCSTCLEDPISCVFQSRDELGAAGLGENTCVVTLSAQEDPLRKVIFVEVQCEFFLKDLSG